MTANVADEKIMPENGLEVRYERYKGIIKNFTLMSDIFMRNVFKQRECLECSAGHYGKTGSESN